jgi:large subunit ribosomal protein L15
MKLHDLRPAAGAHRPRTRVGRGIAAGKGKTAGRGTKGQKSRTGGTIQPWFEGGQTPIHVRIPKLRGFRNMFRIEYEIVNVGRISALAETGILDLPELEGKATKVTKPAKPAKPAPVTITPDILAAAGLVRSLDKPLKVLGHGDVTRPLFIVADAFSKSATAKIEAAGGTAQVLEFPAGREGDADEAGAPAAPAAKPAAPAAKADAPAAKAPKPDAPVVPAAKPVVPAANAAKPDAPAAKPAKPAKSKPATTAARAKLAAAESLPPTSPADEPGSEA